MVDRLAQFILYNPLTEPIPKEIFYWNYNLLLCHHANKGRSSQL